MPTPFTFRLSTYLALALAVLCLAYAEYDLLPEVAGFAALTFALMGVAFRREGRPGFSHRQANALGTAIALLGVGWVAWQSTQKNSLIRTMTLPSGFLPYMGAVLLLLIPAKLLRPKHVGDWWGVQGIGLATAGLACAISDEGLFGLLFALYALAAVWSLGLFFLLRWAGRLAPAPGVRPAPPPAVVGDPGRRYAGRAAGWFAGAGTVAVAAFLATPPAGVERWQFGKADMETGYAGDAPVELGRTGEFHINRDEAFAVTAAYPDGRPKDDLPPNQLWRGTAYFNYEEGRGQWRPGTMMISAPPAPGGRPRGDRGREPAPAVLPDLGPGSYVLEYKPTPKLAGAVLAAPLVWVSRQPPPVLSLARAGPAAWVSAPDGSFRPPATWNGVLRPYKQAVRPPAEPGLGTGFEIVPGRRDPVEPLRAVAGLPRLKKWAKDKVGEFVARGRLPPEVLRRADERVSFRLDPADHEAAARAFRDYFAGSGEFKYDMKVRRADKAADPVEDFLFATKTGHCERFAAALALSLRAVGVPCAFVTGFKGAESLGEGRYVVHQESAHAWVDVLVHRPAPPDFQSALPAPPAELWHWLSLDPTPDAGDGAGAAEGFPGWVGAVRDRGARLYADFIIGYNPDRRAQVAAAAGEYLTEHWPAVALAAGIVFTLAGAARGAYWWRGRRRAAKLAADRRTGVDWYDDFRAALARAGHLPAPGQTPAEYAADVSAALRADPRMAPLADTPAAVTAAFYETRYAGRPTGPGREADLRAAVRALTVVLPRVS